MGSRLHGARRTSWPRILPTDGSLSNKVYFITAAWAARMFGRMACFCLHAHLHQAPITLRCCKMADCDFTVVADWCVWQWHGGQEHGETLNTVYLHVVSFHLKVSNKQTAVRKAVFGLAIWFSEAPSGTFSLFVVSPNSQWNYAQHTHSLDDGKMVPRHRCEEVNCSKVSTDRKSRKKTH